MLWHGTHEENMIGILRHGLKMDATNGSLRNPYMINFGSVRPDLFIGEFTKPGRQRQPERHLEFRKGSLFSVRYI